MKIWILVLLMNFLVISESSAALNLSATPTTGGNNLHFGRIDPKLNINKEVRLRITSTDGRQYQVFQRLVEPPVNEQGQPLDRTALTTYTLVGSNSSGTLYLQNPERLGPAEQLVYSSGANGDSDSMTILYAVDFNKLEASGNFLGKIQYLVRSLGTGEQDTIYLNLALESEGESKIEIQGSHQKDTIRINSDDKAVEDSVEISFTKNVRGPLNIYQEIERFPQNEMFEELKPGSLNFSVDGTNDAQATAYQAPTSLERNRILIYSTREDSGKVVVHLRLNDKDSPRAGVYRGKIRYSAEGKDVKTGALNLEIDVKPVFVLDVELPPEGMKFTKLMPDQPPEYHEVSVKIDSNLGKPYMVTQKLVAPLANEKGESIVSDAFSMKEELKANSLGKPVHTDFKTVLQEEAPIFFSDSRGSSAEFKVIYRLRADKDGPTGDFRTDIVYSLGEM